jgi:hypothetical protein
MTPRTEKENQLATPVAMIVFRRPDVTHRVFAAVAKARPSRLFLIADGPRTNRPQEAELCEDVRRIVTAVDWPCEVETNFAQENMGLRPRVVSGLNWVFSQVDEAIILEDDCLPDPSFFSFCSELLERYRDRPQIGSIMGFNPLEKVFPFEYSYFYSLVPLIWGWATWRRAWQEFDDQMESWPEVKVSGLLDHFLPDKKAVKYWSRIFDRMYNGTGESSWYYRWIYTCWTRNWLGIVPRRNLVQNIGIGAEATHTTTADPIVTLSAQSISFPLSHPPAIVSWRDHVVESHKWVYTPTIRHRLRRRMILLKNARPNEWFSLITRPMVNLVSQLRSQITEASARR